MHLTGDAYASVWMHRRSSEDMASRRVRVSSSLALAKDLESRVCVGILCRYGPNDGRMEHRFPERNAPIRKSESDMTCVPASVC